MVALRKVFGSQGTHLEARATVPIPQMPSDTFSELLRQSSKGRLDRKLFINV
jgi:hypothetical protein